MDCPQPVLATKNLTDEGADEVRVRVDNPAARSNVENFLTSQGFRAGSVEEAAADGREYVISAKRVSDGHPEETDVSVYTCVPEASVGAEKIVILIGSDKIGRGDDSLGAKLMENFLATLGEMGDELWRVILVNNGVKLAARRSPARESLQGLEEAGLSILVCGTCLEHFGLMGKNKVGQTTNMLDVVTSLQVATKVINL